MTPSNPDRKTALEAVRKAGILPASETVPAGKIPAGPTACKAALPDHLFIPFDASQPVRIHRRHLPHWWQEGVTYFVTFRLADSVPQSVLDQWRDELALWFRHHPEPWDGKTQAEYQARFNEAREEWLDRGHGSCVLRRAELASLVAQSLLHFDGERYVLDAFVVMPNHVHVLVKPSAGHELSDIIGSWKRHTARELNRAISQSGQLWMDESYDHIVRDAAELQRLRDYIAQNPVKAKLGKEEFALSLRDALCSKTGLQLVRPAGILPANIINPTSNAGKIPATQTACKAVLQFPLCKIEGNDGWRKLPGTMVYDGPYVQIEECSFLTPARPEKPTPWTVAHRKSAVAVAPITEDGRFVLIHQERLPVQRSLWEFPAGQIDDEHSCESIVATVLRELDEEAGAELTATGTLTPLGWFFGSQGFTGEHVYLFAAQPVHIVRHPQPVGGEHIGEVQLVTGEILREMITNNTIQDALTLALFARMTARGMV